MFIRKYWLPLSVFIVAIVGIGLYYLQTRPPKDPIVIYKPVEPLPKSEVAEAPERDTSQGGHRHTDGTWHEGPHEPVEQPAEAPSEPIVEINHEWASLTDEERLQREKEQNQVFIDVIADDPRYAELYKLMTENKFPYSPEVEAQIHEANMRITQKGAAYDKAVAEIDAKMSDPNISPRELGRLTRERHELRERYKGGQ